MEYSEEDQCLFGKLIGIKDAVIYEGESVSELRKMFQESVDSYLKMCEKHGDIPQKPYKGSFNVRISPELHMKAAARAKSEKISLNQVVEEAIKTYV